MAPLYTRPLLARVGVRRPWRFHAKRKRTSPVVIERGLERRSRTAPGGDGMALTDAEVHDALQQARDIVLGGMCAASARGADGSPLVQLRSTASPHGVT